MDSENARLLTFRNRETAWGYNTQLNHSLAALGFFYLGRNEIQCFSCNVVLSGIHDAPNTQYRHALARPDCLHLRENVQNNIELTPPSTPPSPPQQLRLNGCATSVNPFAANTRRYNVIRRLRRRLHLENSTRPMPPPTANNLIRRLFFDSDVVTNGDTAPQTMTTTIAPESMVIRRSQLPKPQSPILCRIHLLPTHSAYQTYAMRLKSFDLWPVSMTQTRESMADAGFFYYSKSDFVTCHHCDRTFKNWMPHHDPWQVHALADGNTCYYVLLVKGCDFPQLPAAAAAASASDTNTTTTDTNTAAANITTIAATSQTALLCKICYEHELSVLFSPCGHVATCGRCASAITQCVICRADIIGTTRAILS